MYLVEKEIRTQFDALKKTVAHAQSCAEAAAAAFAGTEKLCVLGCGSSFSLAKSAATQFSQHTGIPAFALPAGDLLVNFDAYEKMICGSTVLLLSRSGSTSEVLRAAGLCRTQCRCRILSICAKADAPVEELADWSLVIPWAFDEAVCQTRTVSNLYAAALALICMVSGDENELHCLSAADTYAEAFCRMEEERLAAIAAGEADDYPETAFFQAGTLDDVCRRAAKLRAEGDA